MCPFFKAFAQTLRNTPPVGTLGPFPRVAQPGCEVVKVIIHLVPRLRTRGATPLFPQYVFMEWCLIRRRGNFTAYRKLIKA